MEDIKVLIEKTVASLQKDGNLKKKFQSNPIQTAEQLLGIKLPKDMADKLIAGVKAKLNLDVASGALDQLKKLF